MEFKRRSIFEDLELLKEADDDGDAEMAAATGDTGGDDTGGDDDINIDADLKSEDNDPNADTTPADDAGGGDDLGDLDDLGDNDDNGGGDTTTDTSGLGDDNNDEDGEANPANTDIFSSLSKEEQQIKIQKLKDLFGSMYSSCNDIGEKIDNIDYDIANHETVSRLAAALYRLKDYISDYITKVFPNKDYYQNTVEYWKFIASLNSITKVTEELCKLKEKEQKDDKK